MPMMRAKAAMRGSLYDSGSTSTSAVLPLRPGTQPNTTPRNTPKATIPTLSRLPICWKPCANNCSIRFLLSRICGRSAEDSAVQIAEAQIDEGDLGHGQTEGTAEDDVDHERRDQGDEQALEPAFGGKVRGQQRDLQRQEAEGGDGEADFRHQQDIQEDQHDGAGHRDLLEEMAVFDLLFGHADAVVAVVRGFNGIDLALAGVDEPLDDDHDTQHQHGDRHGLGDRVGREPALAGLHEGLGAECRPVEEGGQHHDHNTREQIGVILFLIVVLHKRSSLLRKGGRHPREGYLPRFESVANAARN